MSFFRLLVKVDICKYSLNGIDEVFRYLMISHISIICLHNEGVDSPVQVAEDLRQDRAEDEDEQRQQHALWNVAETFICHNLSET